MKSSFVVENCSSGKESQVIEAMQRLEAAIPLETDIGDINGLYGHTVIIQTGDVTIRNDTLDCEFDIPFDDDTEADEADILIYNLSETTQKGIRKGEAISVTAGYGEDTGVIFSGIISQVSTKYSGIDQVTQIYALDSENRKEQELKSIAYKANTAASSILKDLIGRAKLPIAVFAPKRDYVYKDGKTISGGLMDNIKKMAQVCGVSAYICKGQVYVRSVLEGDAVDFTLSSATGLLDLSEFEEELTAEDFSDTVHGYNVKMLLQHRVQTGSILNIQSRNVSGAYRVREGSHTYDGTDFLTTVKAIESLPGASAAKESESSKSLPDLSGYSGVSIVDGLKSAGADSSYAYRKILAEQLGMSGYSGSASQNLEMLRKLGAKVG
ncbi:MAG: hypothetical protein Q4C66_15200 [Lachnospiraceae bacterium]|nr:hypothetical protein [Lachnospiraceae bacterium]